MTFYATGAVLRYHDYLPFGEEWQPQTPAVDKRLFTDQQRDIESGLDYFGARYYRPDLGRFTTERSARESRGSANRFSAMASVRLRAEQPVAIRRSGRPRVTSQYQRPLGRHGLERAPVRGARPVTSKKPPEDRALQQLHTARDCTARTVS